MPGLDPSGVSTAVDTAINLYKVGQGIAQNAKANKLAKNVVPLHYDIPTPTTDAYNLAESNASTGMSAGSESYYNNNADRGLTTSVDAILRGGGSVNNISDLYDNFADHGDKVHALDNELRIRNQDQFYRQASNMSDALDKKWQLNVYKPHEDMNAYISGLRGMGYKNVMGGLDGIGGAVGNWATSKLYKDDGITGGSNHPVGARTQYVEPSGPTLPNFMPMPAPSDYNLPEINFTDHG